MVEKELTRIIMNYSEVVSIIVPVYEVEAYLSTCIDSLLAQTYQDIEIILVDDESPDHCPQICDTYAMKDSRIQVFHKKNGGAASARNVGLDKASGKYVCFVDSDDVVCKTYVATLVARLEATNADLAVCSYYKLYKTKKEAIECIESNRILSQKEYLLQFLDDWTCGLIWNKIFKREKIGMVRFAEGHKIDDEFFTYQVVMNCDKVVLFDEPLYEYRMRISSVMGTSKKYEKTIISDKLEYQVERYEKVTTRFPDLTNQYLRNLMDNLILLLFKSQPYSELKSRVWLQIKKYSWSFFRSSVNMKEKIGILCVICKITQPTNDLTFVRAVTDDYFE